MQIFATFITIDASYYSYFVSAVQVVITDRIRARIRYTNAAIKDLVCSCTQ